MTITFTVDNDLDIAGILTGINAVNAGSSAGSVVVYAPPTASDQGPGATVSCDHNSGDLFPIGDTVVTCVASDSDDSPSTVYRYFTIRVLDTDLALTGVPANIVTPAAGTTGAVVAFTAPTAVDEAEDARVLSVTCDHNSGDLFPIGTTTVTCTGHDTDDLDVPTASFTVTVLDTDLGITGVPANIVTNATNPAGAAVTYRAPVAVDESDTGPAATIACDHASGSTFAIGTTTVTCTATDPDDTPAAVSAKFTVTVRGIDAQLGDLNTAVQGVGPGKSLAHKVSAAQSAFAAGQTATACSTLSDFINEVNAQTGKKISTAQAQVLIAAASNIRAVMGC